MESVAQPFTRAQRSFPGPCRAGGALAREARAGRAVEALDAARRLCELDDSPLAWHGVFDEALLAQLDRERYLDAPTTRSSRYLIDGLGACFSAMTAGALLVSLTEADAARAIGPGDPIGLTELVRIDDLARVPRMLRRGRTLLQRGSAPARIAGSDRPWRMPVLAIVYRSAFDLLAA